MMDKNELILSTLALFEANYGAKLDPAYRAFLVRKLQPLPEEVITQVFDNVIDKYSRTASDEEYRLYAAFPDCAVIKKELDKLYRIPSESEKKALKADTAWNALLNAIERYGSYTTPVGLDETTIYCLSSMGGWRYACNWLESDLNWRKKEFVDLYMLADGRTEELMLGVDAIEALGMSKREPTAIGDMIDSFMAKRKPKELER